MNLQEIERARPLAEGKRLRSEEEIIAYWTRGDVDSPLLSIRCSTYNHALYIEEAIQGFLIQETDFPIEIWIHDDASTDGTAEIVKRYQSAYPRIIKCVLQTENQYSKGNKPGSFLRPLCKGKYMAVCEGDDYWLDKNKLQKQVDYLEEHPECVISCHNAIIIDQFGSVVSLSKLPEQCKRDYSGDELARGRSWLLTLTWVYRNINQPSTPERSVVRNGDAFFVSTLGAYGGSHYHADIEPAVYRRHAGGVWSSISEEAKRDEHLNTMFMMYRYYKRIKNHRLESIYYRKTQKIMLSKMSVWSLGGGLIAKIIMLDRIKKTARPIWRRHMAAKLNRILGRT